MPTLPVEKRGAEKAKTVRRAGKVPAVVYGAHREAISVALDARAFDKVLKEAGESSIVTLAGLSEGEIPTLIHEVDLDPVTHRPRHADFYAVTKGQMVEVAIPLEFIGEAPAVLAGHNLVKVLHEIEVRADPMRLPHSFTVDVSALADVGAQIHVRELVLPQGVELVTEPEEVVALIQEVQAEKVEEPAPADLSQIEVEGKGKEPEAGVEAAAPEEPK